MPDSSMPTTGAVLGRLYKDLLDAKILPETAEKVVLIAAQGLTRNGEITVSEAASA